MAGCGRGMKIAQYDVGNHLFPGQVFSNDRQGSFLAQDDFLAM
jgi:hypothetical protein